MPDSNALAPRGHPDENSRHMVFPRLHWTKLCHITCHITCHMLGVPYVIHQILGCMNGYRMSCQQLVLWHHIVDRTLCRMLMPRLQTRARTSAAARWQTHRGGVEQSLDWAHWGWVTHMNVNNLTIVDSDDGVSPGRRQAIIWTNAGMLLSELWE